MNRYLDFFNKKCSRWALKGHTRPQNLSSSYVPQSICFFISPCAIDNGQRWTMCLNQWNLSVSTSQILNSLGTFNLLLCIVFFKCDQFFAGHGCSAWEHAESSFLTNYPYLTFVMPTSCPSCSLIGMLLRNKHWQHYIPYFSRHWGLSMEGNITVNDD